MMLTTMFLYFLTLTVPLTSARECASGSNDADMPDSCVSQDASDQASDYAALLQGKSHVRTDTHGLRDVSIHTGRVNASGDYMQKSGNFTLPSSLKEADSDHEHYGSLSWSAERWAVGKPGKGGIKEFKVVQFKEDTFVYRLYGSNSKCGYWWTLEKPQGTWEQYRNDNAICSEWNSATHVVKCKVPAGTATVVGPGQTATCQDGNTLTPGGVLQLNGGVCSYDGAECEDCTVDHSALGKASCYD